ncbi:kinase-like protein [Gigaspora margarita]|uniref:Kinase-like protein n=1 Tax=Gigaspora margarita TaxID=4874 RepID=A0A8H4AKG5_GIGMA|nr:kinase-like protein [Gigaspora margarita]
MQIDNYDLNKLDIPYDEFSKTRWLKRSDFGIFKDAIWTVYQKKVALLFPKEKNQFSKDNNRLSKLKEIKHDNIIEFHGTTYDLENDIKMLVLQHSTDKSLKEHLIQNSQNIEPADKLNIAKDIVCGLKYLHDEGITHGDLHPKSILIDNKRALITNPIIFVAINRSSSVDIMRDKIPYQDPRLLRSTGDLPDKESDVYSLGFILWRVFSNGEPFSNYEKNLINLVNEIHQNKREKPTVGTPKKYISVYEKCWSSNLNERPSIKQVHVELKKIQSKH